MGMLLRILKIKPPDGTAGGGGDCGVHSFCGTRIVLDDKEQLVDLHRRSQFSAVVLEDKIMLYVITFLGGAMLGGIFGVFTMCMMIQAGQSDDREERWFDGRRDK